MKATKMLRIGAVGLLTLVVLAGCGGPKIDTKAQDELQVAMVNASKVKSESYNMELSGKVIAGKDSATAAEFKELSGSVGLSGVFDMKTKDNPKFTVKIEAKGSADGGKEQSVGGEMRLAEKNMYFSLNNLAVDAIPDLYKAAVAQFLNKWWFVALPAESFAQFNAGTVDEKDMTPEQKKLKKLMEKTRFFKNVTNEGEEKIGSVMATKYSVELDKEAFADYVSESEKIVSTGSTDIGALKDFMKSVEFKGFVWVSKEDQMFRKLDGKVTVAPSKDTDNASMEFQFGYTVDDINKDLKVEVPAGAEAFDLGKILGMPAEVVSETTKENK